MIPTFLNRSPAHRHSNGFTLIELSIVLVIIGLLVGGIFVGQSLIRASQVRAVSAEYGRYSSATNAFRDKYFAIPGDFREASQFWGRLNANADCITNGGAAVTTPGACDGVGDRRIDPAAAASQSGEEFQAWRHLALAGMIEGNYTGLAGSAALDDMTQNVNVPGSRLSRSLWRMRTMGDMTASANSAFGIDYGNTFETGASLTPIEAWSLDDKMDDGKPAQGKVIGRPWNSCTNAASRADLAGIYQTTSEAIVCQLIMRHSY